MNRRKLKVPGGFCSVPYPDYTCTWYLLILKNLSFLWNDIDEKKMMNLVVTKMKEQDEHGVCFTRLEQNITHYWTLHMQRL